MPSDIRYAPAGQTPVEPTFDGLDTLPDPDREGDDLEEVPGRRGRPERRRLRRPQRRRHAADHRPDLPLRRGQRASPGAFPRYYDGSWLINNRGSDDGFWKEVQLRKDNNEMLRVNDWLPYNSRRHVRRAAPSLVIGTQFGPDGAALHGPLLGRLLPRRARAPADQTQIVKISFNVQDECLTDTAAPNADARGHRPGVPGPGRHVRQLGDAQADRDRLRLRRRQVDRVPRSRVRPTGSPTRPPSTFTAGQDLHGRVPRDRPQGQRLRGQDGHVQGPRDQRRDRPDGHGRHGGQPGPAQLLRRLRHAHADGHRRRDRFRHRQDRVPRQRRRLHARTPLRSRSTRPAPTTSTTARPTRSATSRRSRRSRSASSRARAAPRPAPTSSTARRSARSGCVTRATAARRRARSRSPAASCTCRRPTSSSTRPAPRRRSAR